MDFVLDRKIIECDGEQYHKTKSDNDEKRALGSDEIQDRCFLRLGYEVFHIDSKEWNGRKDKAAFIREKLKLPDA